MPMLRRGLSPFSDSSRKGVGSDTARHMYRLTTIQIFFTVGYFPVKQVLLCLSLENIQQCLFTTKHSH